MAQTSTGRDQPDVPNAAGHLRVAIWFAISGVVLLATFLIRLDTLQPNWLVLLAFTFLTFAVCWTAFRDLWSMKSRAMNRRYGAPTVMHVLESYLLPSLVPIAFAYAAVALHVERKHKVRVFIGNRGWLYLPQEPRNSAI